MEPSPYGFTVFCDDIRQEDSGKRTFVGTYAGTMIINATALPAAIPTFGFAVTFMEPEELVRKREFPIPIHIYLPGDTEEAPSIRGELAPNLEAALPLLDAIDMTPALPDMGPRMLRADLVISVTPLVIREAGWIRIRAPYKEETIRLGTLKVIVNPQV
jgi:hypothetical protein